MPLFSFKPFLAALATAALLTACGGSSKTAPPPVGGLIVTPGEGGVTLTWTAASGVEYWAYTAPAATICKNCGANDWKAITGAMSRGLSNAPISSPYFFNGLTNDTQYAFIMDGRINGGPGGDATPSVATTPRLAGGTWQSGGALGSGNVVGMAFGATLNPSTNVYVTTGTYLALGANGAKYKSADGLTWSAISGTDTTNWRATVYGMTKFIGVGDAGAITYSTDLNTWTAATSGVTQHLNAVATSGALIVAVGNNGTILRSTDAINWTAATSNPSSANLYGVGYTVNGLWVAVGATGTLLTSSDGATWTAATTGTTADLKSVASMSNVVTSNNVTATVYSSVVVGENGTLLQSPDSLTWAAQTLGTSANLNAVVASVGLLPSNQLMIAGDGGRAYTSTDGVTWTARTTNTSQNLVSLFRGTSPQTRYVALGANGTTVYTQ